jgi:predicted metal-dependent peptidase
MENGMKEMSKEAEKRIARLKEKLEENGLSIPKEFPVEDYHCISNHLSDFDGLVGYMWFAGVPKFSTAIPTAAMGYDEATRKIVYLFNPFFYMSNSFMENAWIVVHEILHLILDHSKRTQLLIKRGKATKDDHYLLNIAADIIVNKYSLEFGFSKKLVPLMKEAVWRDEFPCLKKYRRNIAFEEIVEILLNNKDEVENFRKNSQGSGGQSDEQQSQSDGQQGQSSEQKNGHPKTGNGLIDDITDARKISERIRDAVSQTLEGVDKQSKEDFREKIEDSNLRESTSAQQDHSEASNITDPLKENYNVDGEESNYGMHNADDSKDSKNASEVVPASSGRGYQKGAMNKIINDITNKKSRKLMSYIKKMVHHATKHDYNRDEQWAMSHPRLRAMSHKVKLPYERPNINESLPEVWFFMDTSGSCAGYSNRFFNLVKNIPEKGFKIKPFTFDTEVYPIDIKKREMPGGGGTSLQALENYIQLKLSQQEINNYPVMIFAITDCDGGKIDIPVGMQKRWFWLVTNGGEHYSKHNVPDKCTQLNFQYFEGV